MLDNEFALESLEITDNEPVFAEQWQAQVLAIAENLIQQQKFSAKQWSEALGREIENHTNKQILNDKETYYKSALIALESLAIEHANISSTEITTRKEEWRDAYLKTPHGNPVSLDSS